jgi:hypothetical protein
MPAGAVVLVNDQFDPNFPQPAAIEVYECVGRPAEYILSYSIDIVDGDFPLLGSDSVGPDSILSVIAEVGDTQACLVKGPVFGQSIKLVHGGEGSSLLVQGADTRIKMDRESKAKVFTEGADSDAVNTVLSDYGFTSDVADTQGRYSEDTHSLVQRETDLEFVNRLARQNGFLFWVTTDTDGHETAHFKQPVLDGDPAAQLLINQEQGSTLKELNIDWNIQTAASTTVKQIDLSIGDELDGSESSSTLKSLGSTALADILTDPAIRHIAAPSDDVGGLLGYSDGLLLDSTFFITARCETTTTAAQQILRSHTLIEIQGAGTRHSGLYFCVAARHKISETEHLMDLTLNRNGWN